MSEEKIQAHIAGETLSTEVRISSQAIRDLEEVVRNNLREDVRALTEIRKYLKTPETFSHSLGNLYLYTESIKICQGEPCHSLCFRCPKENKGYVYSLSYNKIRDEIDLNLKMCKFQAEKDSCLNRVQPCDHKREDLYYQFSTLMESVRTGKQRDVQDLFLSAMKLSKQISSDSLKSGRGLAIHGINSKEYARDLLSAICYMFAKLGKSCSYIKTQDLFTGFTDRDYRTRELSQKDFEHILSVDVLCLEDFDLYPYGKADFNVEHLFGLLKARYHQGRLTFLTLSQNVDVSKLIYRHLKDTDCLKEAQDIVETFLVVRQIKDIDIR